MKRIGELFGACSCSWSLDATDRTPSCRCRLSLMTPASGTIRLQCTPSIAVPVGRRGISAGVVENGRGEFRDSLRFCMVIRATLETWAFFSSSGEKTQPLQRHSNSHGKTSIYGAPVPVHCSEPDVRRTTFRDDAAKSAQKSRTESSISEKLRGVADGL